MEKLRSRKLWAMVCGSLLPLVTQALTGQVGWMQAVLGAVGIIGTYIAGQSYVDGRPARGSLKAAPDVGHE